MIWINGACHFSFETRIVFLSLNVEQSWLFLVLMERIDNVGELWVARSDKQMMDAAAVFSC
jgi:hypothetical protein